MTTIRCLSRGLSYLLFCAVLTWSPRAMAQANSRSLIYHTDYEACIASAAEPVAVQFSTDSTDILDWWWTFGDGQQSFDANPVVEYTTPGNYTVTVALEHERFGQLSIVEENLIQINQLLFEDDFELFGFTDQNWQDFVADLMVDSALEFELMVKESENVEQNGDIICLNGGGEDPPLPAFSARVFFDLELIAEDPRTFSYSAFRLVDGQDLTQAGLQVRRRKGAFEIRLESLGEFTPWHPLVQPSPVLTVGLDWYQDGSSGGVMVEIREGSQPAVIQHLTLTDPQIIQSVQLGVMAIDWPEDEPRAGRMRVDNFRTCAFEHQPNL